MLSATLSKKMGLSLAGLALMSMQVVAPVQAAMVGTQQVIQAEQTRVDRAELLAALDRADVRNQLEAMGVDPSLAAERVANLTDAEVAELNQRIADLPAGGSALGVIVFILLVFVITDIIGATDIYPFIHPAGTQK